jgi:hypothetical protein
MSYSSIITKDLPLVSWQLDDSVVSSGSSLASDEYVSSDYDGTYNATVTKKSVPIIFGSNQSVIVTQNTGGYAIEIPSLDRFSSALATSSGCLEFWIKFIKSSFSSPSTMTKIVGKPNSITGVYIHNSSVIAIIGDSFSSCAKAVVPVDNFLKPMHIAFSYNNNSVYLSVNGQSSSATSSTDVFSKAYSSGDEYFRFEHPGTGLDYALDNISIYSRVLDHPTCIRHMTYGLGYTVPEQVAQNYGGYRYNIAMAETPIVGKFEKGDQTSWSKYASLSNVQIANGYISSSGYNEPSLLYAKDKDSSVFSWDGTSGLNIASGGYVYLPYANTISKESNHGFAVELYKSNTIADGSSETLLYVSNPSVSDRYIRFYINGTASGEELVVQMNNKTPVTLMTGNPISGLYSVGYFYNDTTQTMYLFAGKQSGGSGVRTTSYTDLNFSLDAIRVGSSPVYETSENYADIDAGSDKQMQSGIKKIVHLSTVPTLTSFSSIYTGINTAVNNYTATVSSTEKRFVVASTASYEFNIDLKVLSGHKEFIGNNIVEWGHDGPELTVSITGRGNAGEDNWLAETVISNRTNISQILGTLPGDTKYLNVVLDISSNDIIHNPAKIFYFRILTYPTTSAGTSPVIYSTNIVSNGPDVMLNTTVAKSNISFPQRNITPFLYNNEQGGIYVPYTAVIDYDSAPISGTDANSGMYGISLFLNIPSGQNSSIFSVTDGTTTRTLSYTNSSTSLSSSGSTIYINGVSGSTITPNVWNHITVVFDTRLLVTSGNNPVITFGNSSNTSGFYMDEITVFDKSLSSDEALTLNKIYKGTNIVTIGDTSDANKRISIYDSEVSNTSSIYQPVNGETAVLEPVNFIASSFPGTYNSVSDIMIDGVRISIGDRILVPGLGIKEVSTITKGSAVTYTGSEINYTNSIVYVSEGLTKRGKHYRRGSSGNWAETFTIKKVKAYSKPNTYETTDVYSIVEL